MLFRPYPGSGHATSWYPGVVSRRAATVVHVDGGDALTGIDAPLASVGSLTGTVRTPNGIGVGSARLSLYAPTDRYAPSYSTSTSLNGGFTLAALLPGAYKVRIQTWDAAGTAVEWWQDAATRESATEVVVPAGGMATIAPVVAPGA